MTKQQADLYFGPTHQPCGFTSGVVAQFDGSEEPVVRELLQNSLDAARDAKRSAEVRFVIDEIPKSALPGWTAYQGVFNKAIAERQRWHDGKPSHDEKTVIDHIRETIKSPMVPVMLCIDNGHGLNGKRMDALLTQGNTSKGEQGAGSFGLGHHAAFGASNLRYVIYASKYRTDDDEVSTIASGHAILASHRNPDSPQEQTLAADGYWFRRGFGETAFDGTYRSYPKDPPDLLMPYLGDMQDTGTVVCVAGFNDFRRDEGDPVSAELICRVAAANFSAAVHDGTLTVRVEDEREGVELSVARETLGRVLEPISGQRRAPRQGQIRGELSHQAWRTISEGLLVELSEGERLCIRHLSPSDQPTTRVHVFRRGMWIDSQVQGLRESDFAKTLPFDAVLMLDQGSVLEELIRSAEGPEHRGVDRKRLEEGQKRELGERLGEIAQRLRSEVGEREDREEFTPTGFATISGHELRAAEAAPRPRLPSGGGRDSKPVEGGKAETKASEKKSRRSGVPRPGFVPRYRSSSRAGGEANTVEFHVMVDEEIAETSQVGIRLRLGSGSDGTCEEPLPDTWVPLLEVSDGNVSQSSRGCDGGELELTLPLESGEQYLRITTMEPIAQLELLELDLVRRKPTSEQQPPDHEEAESRHIRSQGSRAG
ncbi:hypothetical protein [Candidatus Poriferisocius sp.]|uniref:hypothetical protein n=1 Tax=Candidatus Poriferisocius sp. TaxID=3101276 RepID=UPI003B02644A